jgi:hypothetical protein
MAERVVLARKSGGSMVPVRWTEQCPDDLNDVEAAEEMGAKWEGEELVTYDFPGMVELLQYYSTDDYLIDND